MPVEHDASTAPHASVEPLEEIARRLARVHLSLATNLDGGRESRRWTLGQLEDLMTYVDAVIDGQAATTGQVDDDTASRASTTKSRPRNLRRETRA